MRKMMFDAILIGGLIAMILGSTGLAGKMSRDFIVAGALLMGCVVCGLFLEFAGRGKPKRGGMRGVDRRLLQQMMEQEKACRAEERRAANQQQAAMLELLRQQGQQQTKAIKAIAEVNRNAMALQAASNRNAMALQAASNRNAMQSLTEVTRRLLSAGAKLDYDTETASYVAKLKGQAYQVSDEEAEEWANVAPAQVNPKLLQSGG